MIDAITKQLNIEMLSSALYKAAVQHYEQDKEFSALLEQLHEDEELHIALLRKVLSYLNDHPIALEKNITFDEQSCEEIKEPLTEIEELFRSGKLDKQRLLELIIQTEYSELNGVFEYIIDTFSHEIKELQNIAAVVHKHRKRIEQFLSDNPQWSGYLDKLERLPQIYEGKVLLVDDDESIVALLKAILRKTYTIDTAKNGEEALGKISQTYYDAIVSDVNMPVMDGIQLYEKLKKNEQKIRKKIIFFTGSDPSIPYFQKNNIRYLFKTASIEEIRKAVRSIIDERIAE